jgi:ribonucleotide monophosphatase NagD (HAD superfamily)
MPASPTPAAFLFDLDGVFYNDTQPIPGGAEVIAQLRELSVPFRFVTNTTSKSRVSLAAKLHSFGVSAEPREIFCPAVAASAFLREKNASSVFFTTTDTRGEFDDVHEDLARPDYVVLGDLGDDWTYARLNRVAPFATRLIAGNVAYWRERRSPAGCRSDRLGVHLRDRPTADRVGQTRPGLLPAGDARPADRSRAVCHGG